MKNFLNDLKIYTLNFLLYLIFFTGLVLFLWLLGNFSTIYILQKSSSNFNLLKYAFSHSDQMVFEVIPIIFFLINYSLGFKFIKRGSLQYIQFLISSILITSVIFYLIFGLMFPSPARFQTATKSYKIKYSKSPQILEQEKIYKFNDDFFYLTDNTHGILYLNNKFYYQSYSYNFDKNILAFSSKVQVPLFFNRFEFPLFDKLIQRQTEHLVYSLTKYHSMMLVLFKPYFFIYFFPLFIFFLFLPSIVQNHYWPFHSFFSGLILGFAIILVFLISFRFTQIYLTELKLLKKYIYYFPALSITIIDLFLILFSSYKAVKSHLRIKIASKNT